MKGVCGTTKCIDSWTSVSFVMMMMMNDKWWKIVQVMLKRAQDVAQAVVQTRSTLSSWSCIGPRRRAISSQLNSKVTDLPEASALIPERRSTEALLAETVVIDHKGHKKTDHCSSSSSIESEREDAEEEDEEEEEEPLISIDQVIAETSSIEEDVTEGELWDELDKELTRQENERDSEAMEEEAAAAKEITEEETVITGGVGDSSTVQNQSPVSASSMDLIENQRFYPPGKIMHIVSVTETESETERDEVMVGTTATVEHVRIYETPRELYRKIRLSRTMINDHYMPMYKKMMELLITELECDPHSS